MCDDVLTSATTSSALPGPGAGELLREMKPLGPPTPPMDGLAGAGFDDGAEGGRGDGDRCAGAGATRGEERPAERTTGEDVAAGGGVVRA